MSSDEDLSGRILDTLKKAERERSITRVPTPMTVSLLLYAEPEADRSVWINGSKYIKGDRIDGLYLIENINTEGVVLSHNRWVEHDGNSEHDPHPRAILDHPGPQGVYSGQVGHLFRS